MWFIAKNLCTVRIESIDILHVQMHWKVTGRLINTEPRKSKAPFTVLINRNEHQ
nr:hypothetical protein Iba_chr02cCG4600 [Ipomoea batatas]GMC63972.1 hypothetical protein Iba_chr02dCG0460 [Ipomoea batatas]